MNICNQKYLASISQLTRDWAGMEIHPTPERHLNFAYRGHQFGYIDQHHTLLLQMSPKVVYELREDLLAEAHPLLPNSCWISYRLTDEDDLGHVAWLLQIAYLLHRVKIEGCSWGADNLVQWVAGLSLSARLERALLATQDGWHSLKR